METNMSDARQNEVTEDEDHDQETPWIESEWMEQNSPSPGAQQDDDDDEPEISTDLFADPDPMETFSFEWKVGTTTDQRVQITLHGYKAELGQTLHSTGLTLWRASNILCDFMIEQEAVVRSTQSVLEVSVWGFVSLLHGCGHFENLLVRLTLLFVCSQLGAGLGMCGIVASKLGARCVTLTDGDTDTLARMRDNVEANGCSTKNNNTTTTMECHQLIWGQHLDRFQERHGTFDLILGSDIIYVEEILEPLWNTVDCLLRGGPHGGGAFWLAYARRNVPLDLVLQQAQKRNFVWKTPEGAEGVYTFSRKE